MSVFLTKAPGIITVPKGSPSWLLDSSGIIKFCGLRLHPEAGSCYFTQAYHPAIRASLQTALAAEAASIGNVKS